MMNSFELHPDRLGTTDERGKRIFLHPADVRGPWRAWRTRVQWILLVVFLALPWARVNGKQALLLDIAHRKFEILGLSLRAHNAPLLLLVFTSAAFTLFFITSRWGRVWCGWACPQTVFIDAVFRRIERWIEGSALERRKLDAAMWNLHKARKRFAKWSLFVLFSLVITHSFLAYFVGTDHLAAIVTRLPEENWLSFLFIAFSTSLILFNFGWFREQFCVVVCPYGRLQSVLMDEHSRVVVYDVNRGEPRATQQTRALLKADQEQKKSEGGRNVGDCVNCYRCVQVCPTGIDIRRGLQMECISCTACMDACDEVMTKLKRPTGLVRYDSLIGKETKAFRLRTALYLTLAVASCLSLTVAIASIEPIEAEFLRARGSPYTTQETNQESVPGEVTVINHFKVELTNRTDLPVELDFEISKKDVSRVEGIELVIAQRPWSLAANSLTRTDIFVRFQNHVLANGQKKIQILMRSKPLGIVTEKEVTLVGPFH